MKKRRKTAENPRSPNLKTQNFKKCGRKWLPDNTLMKHGEKQSTNLRTRRGTGRRQQRRNILGKEKKTSGRSFHDSALRRHDFGAGLTTHETRNVGNLGLSEFGATVPNIGPKWPKSPKECIKPRLLSDDDGPYIHSP
ncbi:hypothetical protein PIB30_052644 [Stylosanthes scabra]|uniref:Uncharacterized protein n=1 Tax=Stylosanthes scabra TaxID=79078 RepID=A0ABU6XFZ5_9FABA|nr:hypothetical protein [Stylosanthes scabra]